MLKVYKFEDKQINSKLKSSEKLIDAEKCIEKEKQIEKCYKEIRSNCLAQQDLRNNEQYKKNKENNNDKGLRNYENNNKISNKYESQNNQKYFHNKDSKDKSIIIHKNEKNCDNFKVQKVRSQIQNSEYPQKDQTFKFHIEKNTNPLNKIMKNIIKEKSVFRTSEKVNNNQNDISSSSEENTLNYQKQKSQRYNQLNKDFFDNLNDQKKIEFNLKYNKKLNDKSTEIQNDKKNNILGDITQKKQNDKNLNIQIDRNHSSLNEQNISKNDKKCNIQDDKKFNNLDDKKYNILDDKKHDNLDDKKFNNLDNKKYNNLDDQKCNNQDNKINNILVDQNNGQQKTNGSQLNKFLQIVKNQQSLFDDKENSIYQKDNKIYCNKKNIDYESILSNETQDRSINYTNSIQKSNQIEINKQTTNQVNSLHLTLDGILQKQILHKQPTQKQSNNLINYITQSIPILDQKDTIFEPKVDDYKNNIIEIEQIIEQQDNQIKQNQQEHTQMQEEYIQDILVNNEVQEEDISENQKQQIEKIDNEKIQNEIKQYYIEQDQIKPIEVELDEIKQYDKKQDQIKQIEVELDEILQGNKKQNEIKPIEVQLDEIKQDDKKQNEIKPIEIELDETQQNDIKKNEIIPIEEVELDEVNQDEKNQDDIKQNEIKPIEVELDKINTNKQQIDQMEHNENQEMCFSQNQQEEQNQNNVKNNPEKSNLQSIDETQITQERENQNNNKQLSNILEETYVENIQNDVSLEKNDFVKKIQQQITTSYQEYEIPVPIQKQQDQPEISKSQRTAMNVLKRELGIDLPQTLNILKKTNQKEIKQLQIIKRENDNENKEPIKIKKLKENEVYSNLKDISNENNEIDDENNEKDDENNEKEDDNNSEDENSNENSNKKDSQITLRRSGRVKKISYTLDNNIYNLYPPKKRTLKEDKNTEQDHINESSSDIKRIEQKSQVQQVSQFKLIKKNEKNKNNQVEDKSKKQNKSSQQKKGFLENNSSYEKLIDSFNSIDDYEEDYKYKKKSKKIKHNEDSKESNKRNMNLFDTYSSNEEDDINKDYESKCKKKLNIKKRNFRNLDAKDDEDQTEDENTQDGDDSFLRLLNSEIPEQEEIQEIDYIFDQMKDCDGENYLKQTTTNQQDSQIDEEDIPFDMPDIEELFKEGGSDMSEIQKIDGSIHYFEQKIHFLKQDQKLKKHSLLDDNNYTLDQEKEIKRLQRRKELLENEIKEKQKIKIEKYRQQLLYFDQKLDHKCIVQQSTKRILRYNMNDKLPSNRFIKYKSNHIASKNEINLCYLNSLSQDFKYDLIGFSTSYKVNDKQIDDTKLIHNFFECIN